MRTPRFEWNPAKAQANLRKHGIGFDEAALAFKDRHSLLRADVLHSVDEERFLLLGYSANRLLVVAHCYRSDGELIRIFSARTATRHEIAEYEEGKNG
ncbi:BrnT family toxin [Massilia sp. MB5]|uniref:BrnT family toxin n=1 Tax=Massilia sp. MB5 TaxID=2919578 RepID=UPI001F10F74A|nr:BrnT family toxin [Massilia sp. MB5]UMR30592.1 BrnT family toxin [Massilia sp. MB5]